MPLSPRTSKLRGSRRATVSLIVDNRVVLELVRDQERPEFLRLLRCDRGRPSIKREQEFRGKTYVPPTVEAKLAEQIRLPSRAQAYGSTAQLFGEVEELFKTFGGLRVPQASLSTYVVFATHFSDCATVAPCLTFSGSDVIQAAQLLRIFGCVARHPLLLSGDGSSLHEIPYGLEPTLILYQPGRNSTLKRFHAASQMRGFPTTRRGTIENLFCPKVIFLGLRNLKGTAAGAALSFVMSPALSATPVLTTDIEAELSQAFQSKFLQYRISNFERVRRSDFDVPQFLGSTRNIARFLGSCVADDPKLQQDLLPLLGGRDEAARAALAVQPESLLIEALLMLCHEKSDTVYIGEITDALNEILKRRGETFKVTARAVGPKVAAFGLFAERDRDGYSFALTNGARRQIHELAWGYSVPTVLVGTVECPLCKEFATSLSGGTAQ